MIPALAQAQEIVKCGAGSYASYAPWRVARSTRHWGDQSRIMQTRHIYMTSRNKGRPIPTNDWWTDALVSRWSGNLWSYPAKVRIESTGVSIAFPSYWIDDGTELKEKTHIVFNAAGDFAPQQKDVDDWHDWDVEMVLRDGEKEIKTTLVHGSPFTWIECENIKDLLVAPSGHATLLDERGNEASLPARRNVAMMKVGGDLYGIWLPQGTTIERGEGDSFIFRCGGRRAFAAVALLPGKEYLRKLAPYAYAAIRATRVDWRYNEATAELATVWKVETEDLQGQKPSPIALQGFQPHHLKHTRLNFDVMKDLVWETPRGKQYAAAGNELEITYTFPGMLPYWAAPHGHECKTAAYDKDLFRDLVADYAARGTFGGDTYWGGKGLLQMAFAMMAARETGDDATYKKAHEKLRQKFEDWLTWDPGEERFFFSYVPKWGGMVGEGTSYDSDAFNDHHFHYGYFTYSGALLCMVDEDFKKKFGPMLRLIAEDYANWDRNNKRFPWFRTFDPWAGHSFAGGVGDGNGNGQESTSEAMQGWGGLYLLGLALGDREMRDAAIFGYVSEARATAEYWFDRDRENIDYTKFKHPYNSNLTCHGVGWWTYFSGDPVWMHSIQWLPNTPALDYLSEDLKFAKWDWEEMWAKKEIGGWFEKGQDRNGNETGCVGDASLGNVLLSYLQRHDARQAAEIFDKLRAKRLGAAMNADTAHMTYWATHSHLTWGELDFSVRADYPCARAFVKNGKRTLMAYNCGTETRTVRFFDDGGNTVGALEAQPNVLTVSNVKTVSLAALPAPEKKMALVPKGVVMPDLALGKKTVVSSQENGGMPGANMVDGDDATRWGSAHDDTDMTAAIDLGEKTALYGAELKWENSHASRYLFQISDDGVKWKDLGGERNGFAGLQRLDFGGEVARWVRIKGLEKATQYGISLFRFSVYGKPASAKPGAPLGMKIEASRAVLKERKPSRLVARAWMGGDKFKEVAAEWESADGTFDGDEFTPLGTNYFATVTARAAGIAATRSLPVEEALAVAKLEFAATNLVAITGEGVKLKLVATDQFGGRMPTKGVRLKVGGPKGAKAKNWTLKKGVFTASVPGGYKIGALLDGQLAVANVTVRDLKDVNLARLATVTASGEENGDLAAGNAADGDMKTRWGSRHRDGEWIKFDLGCEREVAKVVLFWENARADSYKIEVSTDGVKWNTVFHTSSNDGGRQEHAFKQAKARYVRITGLSRNTDYGISLFEVEIH